MQIITPVFTKVKDAVAVCHTLSKPEKMPCRGYSIPAETCRLGSVLRKTAGSVCASCYAMKGRYVFENVQQAMWKRFNTLTNPLWVDAIAFLINHYAEKSGSPYFRWHDSGDLQGEWHLENIMRVCRLTPAVTHWLPTREVTIVKRAIASGLVVPDNLVIRLSAGMIGKKIAHKVDLPISTVGFYDDETIEQCGAYTRGGRCGECRTCWTRADVNYPKH